ncbi:MAG TPA: hypothetical protein VGQ95_04360 [Chthoniobacterales bacterium]|nr:hypothetical protein [Chthoniobacterales bacterium]
MADSKGIAGVVITGVVSITVACIANWDKLSSAISGERASASPAQASPAEVASSPAKAASSPASPVSSANRPVDARLRRFVEDYVNSGNYDTPEIETSFFAEPVIDYYGVPNATLATILHDTKANIRKWPTRYYHLAKEPVLLGQEGKDVFIVQTEISYEVSNGTDTRSGISRSTYKIKPIDGKLKIISVMEAK